LTLASAFAGILIGKYLVDNFKWAAEASLSMGETILTVLAKIKGEYLISVASLSGQQEEAEKKLASRLLTIRMTYLHERLGLDKKFAPPGTVAPKPEVLGTPEDQKATQTLERMNALARKVQDAHKMLRAVQNETAQYMAEMNGDPQAIAMAKLQSELDKFEEQAKERRIGAPAEAQKLIDAAVAAKRQEIQIKKDFQTQSITLDQDKLNAERRVQLDSLSGMDTYFADLEAIQKKYAAARLKPNSPDAKWAGVMEPAELAKRVREQEKKFQEASLGLEADNSKLRGEYYGTSAGHSASGALAEQAAQVEIERKQKLLALSERLAAVAAAIVSIEAKGADTPEKQAELDRKVQEMGLYQQQEELLNRVAAAKQREIQSSRDWGAGARKGFQDYSDAAGNYASQAENAVKNAFGGMEDAMASFMVKNKAEWGNMVDAILMDLVKIQLRASITKPISDFMGSLSIFPSAQGNVLGGDGISALSNGIYSQPTFFGFDQHVTAFAQGGVLGEAGIEAVMPLTRDSSGNLGVRAQGGGDTFYATINLTLPASSGNQAQDKSFADDVGDAMQSGLNTWWEDRYRQAHRPGAIANGGVKL
jgi:lambda family phage tail tape measure protein